MLIQIKNCEPVVFDDTEILKALKFLQFLIATRAHTSLEELYAHFRSRFMDMPITEAQVEDVLMVYYLKQLLLDDLDLLRELDLDKLKKFIINNTNLDTSTTSNWRDRILETFLLEIRRFPNVSTRRRRPLYTLNQDELGMDGATKRPKVMLTQGNRRATVILSSEYE
jgi:hypothetical protein